MDRDDAREALLDDVADSLRAVAASGEPYDGLIPTALDPESGAMLDELPPAIPTQRDCDRVLRGCNLAYDVHLLEGMYAVGEATGATDIVDAADAYVERFATDCTDTATGLFPCGDHAFWNLAEDRVGHVGEFTGGYPDPNDAVFDHFEGIPEWLWAKLGAVDADAVQGFADGIDFHWKSEARDEYDRHAWITKRDRRNWVPEDAACDFPRYSGLFVRDLAVAYAREPRDATREQLRRFLDYWWDKRHTNDSGILPHESDGGEQSASFAHTLALGSDLLMAAETLADHDEDLAATAERRGRTYARAVLDAVDETDPATAFGASTWGGGGHYGATPAASVGARLLAVARRTGTERFRRAALAVGETYLDASFPSGGVLPFADSGLTISRGNEKFLSADDDVPITAGDLGEVVAFLADLAGETGEDRWLDRGFELADVARDLYLDVPRPRGAPTVDRYEADLGSGRLLAGLARLALVAGDASDS